MSKTDSPCSYIGIIDDKVDDKLRKAVTTKEGIVNLTNILSLVKGETISPDIYMKDCRRLKEELANNIITFFSPINRIFTEQSENDIEDNLVRNEQIAQDIALFNYKEILDKGCN